MDGQQRTLTLLSDDMTSEAALEASSNNARENTLLGLPRELRDQIWSYVLDSKYENVNHWNPFFLGFDHRMLFYQTPSPRTTMLQVSRHFSEEGKHRLYQHSTFRVNCDFITGLTLPINLTDTHMVRNIELQVDHNLFLRKTAFRRPTDHEIIVQWHPRELPTQFIEQLEQFGSSALRAERCTFFLNTNSYNKEFLPVIIPVLHALKNFETMILKIAVCPPRFSSPPSAWLLSEPFKTDLESALGEGEFTDDEEGRCCLVFRPREYRIREERVREERRRRGRDAYNAMLEVDEGESEDECVDSENGRVDSEDDSIDSQIDTK